MSGFQEIKITVKLPDGKSLSEEQVGEILFRTVAQVVPDASRELDRFQFEDEHGNVADARGPNPPRRYLFRLIVENAP